eukprot:TRINITY_DN3658_c0_g5_i1.p1 TRINITY_DN3658_c0_g5~~TRINITY_DN3658_c0_g5_i1.p1  ORF type:complete len:402 (-),score=101.98 TRINITY_DN3658_c0_g5_i1:88-1293(-)
MATEDKAEIEKKALPEFLEKLKENNIELDPAVFDEYTPIRFLRARKYDLDAAYLMLTNHLKWRKENNVDTILEDLPKNNKNFKTLERYWPGLYAGADKDGVAVWVERGGQIDADSLLASVSIDDILLYHIYATEKTMRLKKENSAKLGKNCYGGVIIEDVDGFGRKHMSSACIDLFKKINSITSDNYPECLKAFICINSPALISVAFKLVKGFIDPETRKKVHVLGTKYKEELLQYIDEDQIIEPYGGKNSIKLKGGGPYSDLKTNGTTYNPVNYTVGAGAVYNVPVTIKATKAPTSIHYTWNANNDVKFSVTYTGADGKGKKVALIEAKTINPLTAGEQKGSVEANEAGVYVFTYDNSNTWVKTRSVTYHFVVEPPKAGKTKKKEKGEKGEKKKKKKSKS